MNHEKMMKKFVRTLKKAEKMALQNRDAELLVAISDRWYALMDGPHGEDGRIPIGFVKQENDNDSGKASNKRKG
ncbi:MAG: hypothetical protein EBU08_03815 [Micrococcales bacterium]|jgi:hypothetical protein|nr:hypothetical protein [Micrococcales bacterium]